MYHLEVKILSRGNGKRVVAAAAYRSGERLHDERYNCYHDFTKKGGIVYRDILLPQNAPRQFSSREILWNAVEAAECRKDARLAREAIIALPREFTPEEQISLARTFALENFIPLGMCVDLCIHHKDTRNPHAHILLTDRPVNINGFLPKKDRSWKRREDILVWRESWARILNEGYKRKGIEKQVTHESYETLGITDRKPTKHLGSRVLAYAKQHIVTDRILEHINTLQSDYERERLLNLLGLIREYEKKREYPHGRSR